MNHSVVIIGGGAAGIFAACNTKAQVIVLEKSQQLLSKVRISGGGRCNVTHSCFDPKKLVQYYPRGSKELLGPFQRFQPRDTIAWFEERGVELKTEEDGRIFPVTDSSETIIECLLREAKQAEIRKGVAVDAIRQLDDGFELTMGEDKLTCKKLLIASGSSPRMLALIQELGHTIVPQVPSLFTFNIPTSPLLDLSGISVDDVGIKVLDLYGRGIILLTHFGFSGPAVLKLSAFGARTLHAVNYKTEVKINWLGDMTQDMVKRRFFEEREMNPTKQLSTFCPFKLPKSLWQKLLLLSGIPDNQRWTTFSKKEMESLSKILTAHSFQIDGKTTYKQEFVTAGGVSPNEVDFKTMESKRVPNLYFAGEVLDIDGVTGGFNFQNAWTTSWIASEALSA